MTTSIAAARAPLQVCQFGENREIGDGVDVRASLVEYRTPMDILDVGYRRVVVACGGSFVVVVAIVVIAVVGRRGWRGHDVRGAWSE